MSIPNCIQATFFHGKNSPMWTLQIDYKLHFSMFSKRYQRASGWWYSVRTAYQAPLVPLLLMCSEGGEQTACAGDALPSCDKQWQGASLNFSLSYGKLNMTTNAFTSWVSLLLALSCNLDWPMTTSTTASGTSETIPVLCLAFMSTTSFHFGLWESWGSLDQLYC